MTPVELAWKGEGRALAEIPLPIDLDALVPGDTPWELEIGFGKGRFLLARAVREPAVRLLGIEMASKYYRMVKGRSERRAIDNVLLVRGEALYVMSTVLPRGGFRRVHVYFPDPWPKDRHHKRRLFDGDTVDLLLELLAPDGHLCFATDHLDYGSRVAELLESHPALEVERLEAWPEGPRTNYELKYEREGRPILRLEVGLRPDMSRVHPLGVESLTVAATQPEGASEVTAP